MATYYLEEFNDVAVSPNDSSKGVDVTGPPLVYQSSVFTTSEQTAAFDDRTSFVTFHADADCRFELGTNPTATTSTGHLPSGTHRSFWVPQGQGFKLAFYDGTS